MRKPVLCNYHEDSLTWDDCSDGFKGCQYKKALKKSKPFLDNISHLWKCVSCGHEFYDNQGENSVDGIMLKRDGVYADLDCPRCGGGIRNVSNLTKVKNGV